MFKANAASLLLNWHFRTAMACDILTRGTLTCEQKKNVQTTQGEV